MGVYIKDLKKPENCDICPIFLAFTTCGCDRDHCMFQEVPEPHGRLIDADALIQSDRMVGKLMMYGGEYVYTQAEIDRSPTIIPASEEAE